MNIKKIAKALGVKPEYFFEYRLRRLINLLKGNRKHLNLYLRDLEIIQKKRKARKARIRAKKMAEAEEATE
ncbi:hypothetical protein ES708_16000 [subsurface metagenome]